MRLWNGLLWASTWTCLAAGSLTAQGYRLRLDAGFQSIRYRGYAPDSVFATEVTPGPDGGLVSPAGFAVTCRPGEAVCRYYRRGPVRTGLPLVTTADVSVWDLGVPGLRLRARARAGTDLADPDVWPGAAPTLQLVEGYAEYDRGWLTAQGGRVLHVSRLGYLGFDGGRARARALDGALSVTVYGGFGLARGSVLPINSDAVNPLGEFRPSERQLVFGGDLGWRLPWLTGRVLYERQIDPGPDHLISERAGGDLIVRAASGVTLTGGADFDLAFGWLGSAEAALAVDIPRTPVSFTAGGRRYRPHFELWSIWGAFSPVPYHALYGSVGVAVLDRLHLRARGEIYRFDDPDAATPLAAVEDDGWRGSLGATYRHSADLAVTADYSIESGPGAGALGLDAGVVWRPVPAVWLRGSAARLSRSLELRFVEADVWQYALDVDVRAIPPLEVYGGVAYYDETRDRPDAAAFSWAPVQVRAGLRVSLGSSADQASLPPAILRIPEGGAR